MGNLQPLRCPVPWCDDRVAHTAHSRDLDTFEGNGFTVAVELSQIGTRPAQVRVFGFEDGVDYGEQYPHIVLPVIVAAQIGQFVTALGTPAAFDFAAALARGLALIAQGRGQ
jgi:hypothetical protein